jgi:zona occludens toxin
MGSGKTYEVVSVVILGALRVGRRVVSNISGLKYDAMRSYLIKEGVSADKIGTVALVSHDAVLDPFFWRTDESYIEKKVKRFAIENNNENKEAFLQAGDLLVLDEVWRFWEGFATRDMSGRVMNFFRMHRHFVHPETGVTCDVALITQDILDIARRIRAVVEETYQMQKLVTLGLMNHYRVDVYSGSRVSRVPVRSIQRTYNPDFFAFYQSHSQKKEGGSDAVEVNIDNRGNILRGIFFRVFIPLSIVLLIFSFYYVWRFFHPEKVVSDKTVAHGQVRTKPSSSVSSQHSSESSSLSRSQFIPKDKISLLLETSEARLAYYSLRNGIRSARIEVMLPSGVRRHFSSSDLLLYGWFMFFSDDGSSAMITNGRETHVIVTEFRAASSSMNAAGK